MAAKAWSSQQKAVEEVFFQNDAVSLCLLINRRARTMRVVDFRAGPTNAKRMFVLSLAKREGVEKAYTLVERDEVATWVKLGFAKEGNIPGFYKRSDAFLLGCSVNNAPPPREAPPLHSEIRIAVRGRIETTALMVDDDKPEEPVVDRAHEFAERTLVQAKKHAKELADKPLPAAKVAPIKEADAKKAVEKALKTGRAITAFEPFGRDVERRYFSITARGGFELIASTESQACFGNAFLELLTAPKNEPEKMATIRVAQGDVREAPRRRRRQLLRPRAERRHHVLDGVRRERVPSDGSLAESHRCGERAEGRDHLVPEARESG